MSESNKVPPDSQPLVGASEAAAILDVELSTFSHLRRREANNEASKFPAPMAVLRCGPIWKTTDIVRFAKRYTPPPPGPRPGTVVKKATVTKLPVKKTAAKTATKVAATKKAAVGNGDASPDEASVARKPRKVVAKKVPAQV